MVIARWQLFTNTSLINITWNAPSPNYSVILHFTMEVWLESRFILTYQQTGLMSLWARMGVSEYLHVWHRNIHKNIQVAHEGIKLSPQNLFLHLFPWLHLCVCVESLVVSELGYLQIFHPLQIGNISIADVRFAPCLYTVVCIVIIGEDVAQASG